MLKLLCVIVGLLVGLFGGIIAWTAFRPVAVAVATAKTDKAQIYGWALPPDTRLPFNDPDTNQRWWYTTNSEGYKDRQHSVTKQPGTFRILFLGDSITYGYVPAKQVYTTVLERLLPNTETINMGIGGYSTDQLLDVLINDGLKYKPDAVVYQFSGNDIEGNICPNTQIRDISRNKRYRYRLNGHGLERALIAGLPEPPSGQEARQLFAALISEMNRLSPEFYVFVFDKKHNDEVARVCAQSGITAILAPRDYDRFAKDSHPNAEGNRKMAEDLAEYFRNHLSL